MKNLLLLMIACSLYCSGHAQNYSLSFNGTSQYVNIPDQGSIELSANFTIEGWVYPTGPGSQPTEGGILVNKESSYEIARFADGSLQYALSANGLGTDWTWINSGLVLPLNTWSHFAFIKSGAIVTIYLNGAASYTNSSNPATLTANTQVLRIGNRSSATAFLNGTVDEVRIWNIAHTQAEIKNGMYNKNISNTATGLVAYYRMNENTGSSTANSCTNFTGLDGVLVNAPAWQASPVQFSANALSFDGINDAVSIPDDNSLHITTAITLEAWVYATKNSGIQNVVCKSSSSMNTGYIFPRTDDGWSTVVVYLNIGGGWKTLAAPYPSLNAWHHLACTYDGASMKIYIDGVLANSAAQTGTITVNTNPLTLGNQAGFSEFFGGAVDEIRVWNIARTQAQIQAAMNTELNPLTQTGLVSYYTIDQGIATGLNNGLTTIMDTKGNNNGVSGNFAFSGSTSNFVPQFASLLALPVNWLSFTAQKQDNHVLLEWSTTGELNSRRFTVQHSADGLQWNNMAIVPAAGNSDAIQHYSCADNHPLDGTNYYRVMEEDIDGKTGYSKVISMFFAGQTRLLVAPNPVTGGVIHLVLQQAATVSLYNSAGSLVLRKQLGAGAQQIVLGKMAKGIYQLKAGNETIRVVLAGE